MSDKAEMSDSELNEMEMDEETVAQLLEENAGDLWQEEDDDGDSENGQMDDDDENNMAADDDHADDNEAGGEKPEGEADESGKDTAKTEKDDRRSRSGKHIESPGLTLFIGRLHQINEDDLRKHFSKYGTVISASVLWVPRRSTQARSRLQNGFVTMSTQEEVAAALKDTHTITGRVVSVSLSTSRDAPERKFRINLSDLDAEKNTEESLKTFFGKYGAVNECVVTKATGDAAKPTGFIIMKSWQECEVVVAANDDKDQQEIDGVPVTIRRLRAGRQGDVRNRMLWFGGLHAETKESDVEEYFTYFGKVINVTIVRDTPAGEGEQPKSKGYGYLTMNSSRDIDSILKSGADHRIHNRSLVFNRSYPEIPIRAQLRDKKLRVCGLENTSLTNHAIRRYFETHGPVRQMKLYADEGYALLVMGRDTDYEKLAIMRDHTIEDLTVQVQKVDQRPERNDADLRIDRLANRRLVVRSSTGDRSRRHSGDRSRRSDDHKRRRSDNDRSGRGQRYGKGTDDYDRHGNLRVSKRRDPRDDRDRRDNFSMGRSLLGANPYFPGGSFPMNAMMFMGDGRGYGDSMSRYSSMMGGGGAGGMSDSSRMMEFSRRMGNMGGSYF